MVELCKTERCTGCMACYSVCPFDAIYLSEDDLGTVYPHIDNTQCRHCNKCVSVCPVLNPCECNYPDSAYALYTKNPEDRRTCASGGVAATMYRAVIEAGGVVFGCGYGQNGKPILKKAEKLDEIEEFKGSKYVYAFPDKIYRTVIETLKTGVQCLFIGTPCQIAGLKASLQNCNQDNLITVDLICHGTPPWTYLNQYAHMRIHNTEKEIAKVTFRGEIDNKVTIWDNAGEQLYCCRQEEDMYFMSFVHCLIYRNICYTCPYANSRRVSDLTIGDFWGLDENALNRYAGKKSVLLTNTENGRRFLKKIIDRFIIEKRTVEEAIQGNAQLNRPSSMHKDRERFCREYVKSKNFSKAVSATSIKNEVRYYRVRNKLLWFPRIIKGRWKNRR